MNVKHGPSRGTSGPLAADVPLHAVNHETGGIDPLTPDSIGAETPAGAQAKVDAALAGSGVSYHAAGESVGSGSFLHIRSDGKVVKADASSGLRADGYTREAVVVDDTVTLRTEGALNGLSGLSPGALYFVSGITPGQITATPPSSGFVQSVGVASAADNLLVEIEQPMILAA